MTRETFLSWKNQMEGVLMAHKHLPYVIGTLEIPPTKLEDGSNNPDFEKHIENNEIVFSWIKATISSTILPMVIGCKSAYKAWTLLEKEYSPIGKSQIQALREQLRSVRKTSKVSMFDYLLQFKAL